MERLAELGGQLSRLSEYRDLADKRFKKNNDEEAIASADRFIEKSRKKFGSDMEIIPMALYQWKRVVKEYPLELSPRAKETLEQNFIFKKEGRFN